MSTKEKIIEELRKAIGTFEDSFGFNGTIEELADSILGLVKQEIVEEIEKELIKVLKVSKTADDYHIGIAYVIDTFLKSANINQPLTK